MMILCLRGGPVGAAEPAKDTSKPKYRVLFSNDLFNNVNHNDVLVAFKVWIETVLKNRNYPMEAEIDSYDGLDEAEKRIQEGTVDLVIFNSIDYLQTSQTNQLDAVFVAERQKKTMFDDYLLVSRRDRNFTSLADLRGKSVIFFDYGAKLGRLWMDVTLGESGLGSAGEFFGSISDATKATSIVLPVFFGKADACVVGRSSLETMQELNPQLATQLQVLTNSVCLPESVICLPKHYAWDREAALRGLAELDTEPRGQQILLIFKINKLDPFRPEQLDGLRDLKARYDRLSPPTAPQKAVAASTGTPKP
jgi:phosphonate transport system substrate-binding protein